MTRAEADVIEAAQEYCDLIAASKHIPVPAMGIQSALNALMDALAELASENDGRWNYPRKF